MEGTDVDMMSPRVNLSRKGHNPLDDDLTAYVAGRLALYKISLPE
jgi:hypothetical protein